MLKSIWIIRAAAFLAVSATVMAQEPLVADNTASAPPISGTAAPIPCKVYANCEDEGEMLFIASGWMGDVEALEYDDCWKENPHSGASCIKITFSGAKGWGGIVWQNPANNWGDEEGGVNLTGAKNLTFWARGDQGGEMVEFKFGLYAKNKPYWDTARGTLGRVKLESTWKPYTISLADKDLSRILSGFAFSVQGRPNPVTFYLDDIVFE